MSTPDPLAQRAANILSTLVRIPTVSRGAGEDEPRDEEAFVAHAAAIEASFPLLAAACERFTVGTTGILWRWAGTEPQRAVVMAAHQDVVPAAAEDGWSEDPFSGTIRDGRLFGRGTLDDKGDLVCKLLAAETLLEAGFAPAPDVWFFLGDGEEVSGPAAEEAVDFLRQRGVRPELVMDEGGVIAEGAFPGVGTPQAVIGLGEKGLLSVRLTTRSGGGHASFPPRWGAIDRLSRALMRIHSRPFPPSLHPVTARLLGVLAGQAKGPMALALRAAASSGPVGAALLARLGGEAAAMARTTVAFTRLAGGEANNVLAPRADAVLNLRLAPWDSVDSALRRLRKVIRDKQVELEVLEAGEPSPVSPLDTPQLESVRAALAVSHPEATLAPYITIAATDARHFHAICENVYRLAPLLVDGPGRASIHGVDESVAVSELGRGTVFYRELLGNYDDLSPAGGKVRG